MCKIFLILVASFARLLNLILTQNFYVMEWIKFEDRKPKDRANILITDGTVIGEAIITYFPNGSHYFTPNALGGMDDYYWEWDGVGSKGVTHWMPLPELPKD